MPVVDYLLNSLVKHLQKTLKERKKRQKYRRESKKSSRKVKKPFRRKKSLIKRKVKKAPVRKKRKKKASRKVAKKSIKTKKKKRLSKSSQKSKRKVPVRKKIKRIKRKKPKTTAQKIPGESKASSGTCVGEITHYFSQIQVVVLKMTCGKLAVGDLIHILGRGRDFTQRVQSLQIESVDVKVARKGQLVGLKIKKIAKPGDKVFKL